MKRFFGLSCLLAATVFVVSANAETKDADSQPKSSPPGCINPDHPNQPLPPYGRIQLRVSDLSVAKDQINKLVIEKRVSLPEHPSENAYVFGVEPENFNGFLAQMKTIGKIENAEQRRSTVANDHLVAVELLS